MDIKQVYKVFKKVVKQIKKKTGITRDIAVSELIPFTNKDSVVFPVYGERSVAIVFDTPIDEKTTKTIEKLHKLLRETFTITHIYHCYPINEKLREILLDILSVLCDMRIFVDETGNYVLNTGHDGKIMHISEKRDFIEELAFMISFKGIQEQVAIKISEFSTDENVFFGRFDEAENKTEFLALKIGEFL